MKQSLNDDFYCIQPSTGILGPYETIDIKVTIKPSFTVRESQISYTNAPADKKSSVMVICHVEVPINEKDPSKIWQNHISLDGRQYAEEIKIIGIEFKNLSTETDNLAEEPGKVSKKSRISDFYDTVSVSLNNLAELRYAEI